MIQPLKQFLENSAVDLELLTETLLQYIREAEETNSLLEPENLMIVEDCKRFFFILTGVWWTQAP